MIENRNEVSLRKAFRAHLMKQASIAVLLLAASINLAHAQQSDTARPAADQGASRQIVVEDSKAQSASPAASNSRIQVLPPAGTSTSSAQDEAVSPNAAAARAARAAEPVPPTPPPAAQQAAPNPAAASPTTPPPPSGAKQAAPAPQGEPQAAPPPKAASKIVEDEPAPPRKRVKKRRYHDYVEYYDAPPHRYYAPRRYYTPVYRPYGYAPPYYRY